MVQVEERRRIKAIEREHEQKLSEAYLSSIKVRHSERRARVCTVRIN